VRPGIGSTWKVRPGIGSAWKNYHGVAIVTEYIILNGRDMISFLDFPEGKYACYEYLVEFIEIFAPCKICKTCGKGY